MKYAIVSSQNVSVFVERANSMLSAGYIPQGGLSTCVGKDGFVAYAQAFIKEN